jgi:multiple sugar transport system substrate-binding protein
MKKSMLAVTALATVGLLALAGCNKSSTGTATNCTTDTGKVLNIACWNNEFQGRFENFYPDYVKTVTEGSSSYDLLRDGTKVYFKITPNDGNGYQNKLDSDLKAQDSAAADDKIDMFLIEADYATKYTATDYTLDVKGDVGLTDDDLSQMYQYTKDIVTYNGKLKAVSWQATPGLYAYRRDLAKTVMGTDDPVEVQKKLADWDKFNAVAKTAHDKNVFMLSGYDDAYRVYSNNMSAKWVNDSKVVHFDDQIKAWIKATKTYTDSGYNDKTSLWDAQWQQNQGPTGKTKEVENSDKTKTTYTGHSVLGFFYSTWGINFTLAGNSDPDKLGNVNDVTKSLYGDYAVCQGPASWYWGGSWLCAAKGTDNKALVNKIMYTMTCSPAVANGITRITQDYTNNQTAMNAIAADTTYGSDFLGGQNHIALFKESAANISMKNAGAYDQGCNENMQKAMKDYFAGTATLEAAISNFKSKLGETYNGLTFDSSFDNVTL